MCFDGAANRRQGVNDAPRDEDSSTPSETAVDRDLPHAGLRERDAAAVALRTVLVE
jgi:hypothetical protein